MAAANSANFTGGDDNGGSASYNPFTSDDDETTGGFANTKVVFQEPGSVFDLTEYPASFTDDLTLKQQAASNGPPSPTTSQEERVIEEQPIVVVQQPTVHRRQVPVSTVGWVSTSQTQFMPVTGLDFLTGVRTVLIQQTVETLQASASAKRYVIKVPHGETLYATSENSRELERTICGSQRGFSLTLLDHTRQTAAIFVKKLGCAVSWFPCLLQNLQVYLADGNFVGQIKQDFSLSAISFTVLDANGNNLFRLFGPNTCGWMVPLDASFTLAGGTGGGRLGAIVREWNPMFGDYDLRVDFPASGTPEQDKILIIASAFLIVSTACPKFLLLGLIKNTCFLNIGGLVALEFVDGIDLNFGGTVFDEDLAVRKASKSLTLLIDGEACRLNV